MSNPYFKFRQFTVFHDKCAMKVGADGVTLGAWADVSDVKSVLDIGCGSGLIALMIAQRSEAGITAIDIDGQSIEQTKENTGNSPWSERIKTVHASLQQFAANSDVLFDLIVCNPPYFNNSLKSPSESRTMARHTDTLSYTDLITNAGKILAENGRFCLILPVNEGNIFCRMAENGKLYCRKRVEVFPNYEKPVRRLLLEFVKQKTECKFEKIVIEKERNNYTPEYTELVKTFYLDKPVKKTESGKS